MQVVNFEPKIQIPVTEGLHADWNGVFSFMMFVTLDKIAISIQAVTHVREFDPGDLKAVPQAQIDFGSGHEQHKEPLLRIYFVGGEYIDMPGWNIRQWTILVDSIISRAKLQMP